MKPNVNNAIDHERIVKIPHLSKGLQDYTTIIKDTVGGIAQHLSLFGIKNREDAITERVYKLTYIYSNQIRKYSGDFLHNDRVDIGLETPISMSLPNKADDATKAGWENILQNIVDKSNAPTYTGNKTNFSYDMGQGLYLYFVIKDFNPTLEELAPSFKVSLLLHMNELKNTDESLHKDITQKISQSLTENLDAKQNI